MSAFFAQHGSELLVKTWQQIYISAISLGLGIVVAVPLSIILMKFPRVAKVVIAIASMLQTIPALAIDSARGLGMTNLQLILKVDIPLAMPVIMAGIRLSAIYVIAWATLASYIGAGGLGDFIFNGLSLYQTDLIFGGTIPVIILALLTDYLLGKLERKLTPKGI